ncbi:hypothetical protein H312_00055, partial [Anncaliia algerae PRA339]
PMKFLFKNYYCSTFIFLGTFIASTKTFYKDTSKISKNLDIMSFTEPMSSMDKLFENLSQIFANFNSYKHIFNEPENENISKFLVIFNKLNVDDGTFIDEILSCDIKLLDIVKYIICLDEYLNSIHQFLSEVKNIYQTNEFKKIISNLYKIVDVIKQYKESINKFKYSLTNLDAKLQNQKKKKTSPNRTYILKLSKIMILKFSLSQDLLSIFNGKMIENQEEIIKICEKWKLVSINDKFYICHGDEYPGNGDFIETKIFISTQKQLNCFQNYDLKIRKLFNNYVKEMCEEGSELSEIELNIKLLYKFENIKYQLDEFVRSYEDANFYKKRVYYTEKKVWILKYLESKCNKVKQIREKVLKIGLTPNSNTEIYYKHLIFSFEKYFEILENFLIQKLNKFEKLNEEEYKQMIDTLVNWLNVSEEDARQMFADLKEGKFECEWYRSSDLKYCSILSKSITDKSTSILNACISMVMNLDSCLESLITKNEGSFNTNEIDYYRSKIFKLHEIILLKQKPSAYFYYNDQSNIENDSYKE